MQALADARLTDIEVRETHRVHEQATAAIVRARRPGQRRPPDANLSPPGDVA